jgi:hypothetical protein
MQEPSVESQMISVKEEPPDTSSHDSSDCDCRKEDEVSCRTLNRCVSFTAQLRI